MRELHAPITEPSKKLINHLSGLKIVLEGSRGGEMGGNVELFL